MTAIHSSAPGNCPTATLVLLCKRPAPGHSKQRLAAEIGLQPAFRIAELLLACALEDLQQWPAGKVLAPDQAQLQDWAQALCPQALVLAQSAGNLGERLNDLDQRLRTLGHRQLLFIGSDCPVLQADDFVRIATMLEVSDTVLLGARDGGVVLMASNLPWPDLSRLPWSTAQLGQALAECCQAAGQRVQWAGQRFDIDHQQDLLLLTEALQDDPRPARTRLRNSLPLVGVVVHD